MSEVDFGGLVYNGLAASHLDHNRHVAKLSDELVWVAIVNPVLEGSRELASVCRMPFSALGREDFSVFGELVARGEERSLKRDALIADRQFVLSAIRAAIRTVKEYFGANVLQSVVYQAFPAIGGEESVERLDVRIDSDLQEWVGGAVGGRVPEEIFATQSIILVIPLRACPCWSHDLRLDARKARQTGRCREQCDR